MKSEGNADNILIGRSHALPSCICATCERHGKPYCALGSDASHDASCRAPVVATDIVDSLVPLSLLIFSVACCFDELDIMAFRRNFHAGRMVCYVRSEKLTRFFREGSM